MNWCIEATRVVTCIARQFNLRAIPIQVATIVTNAAAVQECGIATPLREYPEHRPCIVHSGVARDDRDHGPDGVNSHVVAMVSGTYVVDLAVAQFRERAEGVFTPDVWAMHAPELELEFGDLAASIFTEEGQNTGRDGGQETMLVYQRRPLSIDLRTVAARTSSTPRAMARSMTAGIRDRLRHGMQPDPALLWALRARTSSRPETDWQQHTGRCLIEYLTGSYHASAALDEEQAGQ